LKLIEKEIEKEKLVEIGPLKGIEILKDFTLTTTFFSNPKIFNEIINFEFYYYDCESVYDRGWGSGWRCFQSLLKTVKNYLKKNPISNTSLIQKENYDNNQENTNEINNDFISCEKKYEKLLNFDLNFQNLFLTYGDKDNLEKIFIEKRQRNLHEYFLNENNKYIFDENLLIEKSLLEKNQLPNYLKNKLFAPFDNQFGWAELFVLDLIMFDLNLEGKIYLLNGYNPDAFTPKEIFLKIISFMEFIEFSEEHFSKERPLPIIIDDLTICICILAINKIEENNEILYRFLIADPHVKKEQKSISGIYSVDVNINGKFIKENNQFCKMNGKRLRFDVMDFMVYIPGEIRFK
jgi:hypothetical protein